MVKQTNPVAGGIRVTDTQLLTVAFAVDFVDVLFAHPFHVVLEILVTSTMLLDVPQLAPLVVVAQREYFVPNSRVRLLCVIGCHARERYHQDKQHETRGYTVEVLEQHNLITRVNCARRGVYEVLYRQCMYGFNNIKQICLTCVEQAAAVMLKSKYHRPARAKSRSTLAGSVRKAMYKCTAMQMSTHAGRCAANEIIDHAQLMSSAVGESANALPFPICVPQRAQFVK